MVANDSIIEAQLGFNTTHFAIPSGDNDGYRLPAFNNGNVAIHGQYYLMQGNGGWQIDSILDLTQLELYRNTLEEEDLPYGEDIDSIALLTQNGNHYWFSEYAHRVGYPGDPYIFIYVDDFKNYMTFIENNFGRYGDDNIWFAPTQEVYEYLLVRDKIEISSTQILNNQFIVEFDLSELPINLRRYSLSLQLETTQATGICNIEVTNSNLGYNLDGLINLDW